MRRFIAFVGMALAMTATAVAPVAAQEMDSSFSNSIISTYGYPEVTVTVGPDGIDAPSTLEAGYYHISLVAEGEKNVGYLNIAQPPAGLSEQEEIDQMLEAGRNDMAQPGWTYLGGTNNGAPGEPVSFVVELKPGEYKIAASYYEPYGDEEIMKLAPLTVTAAATPAAQTAPKATVRLEQTDQLQYIVTPGEIPTGPQVWEITNTGEVQSHHVVMMRVPDGATAADITGAFEQMMMADPATPTPPPALMEQMTWVGYAAMQSGGTTTYAEFDLKPGTYAVICFIFDPATQMPHLMNGMVTVFTVK